MARSKLDRLVLVLNRSFEEIHICTAKRAFILIAKGAAESEKDSTVVIHTSREEYKIPDVIRLVNYTKVPRLTRAVSRKGVMLRDGYRCLYCGEKFSAVNLTLDHVIPKSQGGKNTWKNLVTCCHSCNHKKGDLTPEEAGMALLHQPHELSRHAKHKRMQADENAWDQYLFT